VYLGLKSYALQPLRRDFLQAGLKGTPVGDAPRHQAARLQPLRRNFGGGKWLKRHLTVALTAAKAVQINCGLEREKNPVSSSYNDI
jgi:hypothetical protein